MKNSILSILILLLCCTSTLYGQKDLEYQVGFFNLSLVSPDSNYNHQFASPRISGLQNAALQLDINRFLKSKFFPSRQEIKDFKIEFSVKSPEASVQQPYWDYLESNFAVRLKSVELLMLERSYLHEYSGMTDAVGISEMFAIDMRTGEWIEYLYEFIEAEQKDHFNHLLRAANSKFSESEIFIEPMQFKDFTISENNEGELWLVLYVPPYGEYFRRENGELVTLSNGGDPMRFEFPMKILKHLIVKDSVLHKVVYKRAQ